MPIYEFKCSKCGTVFEKLRQVADEGVPDCTNCGSSDVTKMFSSFGFSSTSRSGRSSAGSSCASCSSSNCSTCGG